MSSPAENTSITVRATSAAMNRRRSRASFVAVRRGPPAFRLETSPQPIPAATAALAANRAARQSIPAAIAVCAAGGRTARNEETSQAASARASPPPASDRTRLSVTSCRTILSGGAPRATRSASSRWRIALRESSRLAKLTLAISSAIATTAVRAMSSPRISSIMARFNGTTSASAFQFRAIAYGNSGMVRETSRGSSSRASSSFAPGRNFPIMGMNPAAQ